MPRHSLPPDYASCRRGEEAVLAAVPAYPSRQVRPPPRKRRLPGGHRRCKGAAGSGGGGGGGGMGRVLPPCCPAAGAAGAAACRRRYWTALMGTDCWQVGCRGRAHLQPLPSAQPAAVRVPHPITDAICCSCPTPHPRCRTRLCVQRSTSGGRRRKCGASLLPRRLRRSGSGSGASHAARWAVERRRRCLVPGQHMFASASTAAVVDLASTRGCGPKSTHGTSTTVYHSQLAIPCPPPLGAGHGRGYGRAGGGRRAAAGA